MFLYLKFLCDIIKMSHHRMTWNVSQYLQNKCCLHQTIYKNKTKTKTNNCQKKNDSWQTAKCITYFTQVYFCYVYITIYSFTCWKTNTDKEGVSPPPPRWAHLKSKTERMGNKQSKPQQNATGIVHLRNTLGTIRTHNDWWRGIKTNHGWRPFWKPKHIEVRTFQRT